MCSQSFDNHPYPFQHHKHLYPYILASSMNSITCQRFHIISSINLFVVNSKLTLYSLCSSYAQHIAHTVPVLHCALTTISFCIIYFLDKSAQAQEGTSTCLGYSFSSHTHVAKNLHLSVAWQACIEAIQMRSSSSLFCENTGVQIKMSRVYKRASSPLTQFISNPVTLPRV